MTEIVRGSQSKQKFLNDVLIILPNVGKVSDCLFLGHATIVYDRTGVVEFNNFEDVVIKCDFPMLAPTDRIYKYNRHSDLTVEGDILVENNSTKTNSSVYGSKTK